MFKCNKCGMCCRNLSRNNIYKEFDRGDGVCKYLEGNLCSIYKDRPLMCNIELSYYEYFAHIDKEDYYRLNYDACEKLKRKER